MNVRIVVSINGNNVLVADRETSGLAEGLAVPIAKLHVSNFISIFSDKLRRVLMDALEEELEKKESSNLNTNGDNHDC